MRLKGQAQQSNENPHSMQTKRRATLGGLCVSKYIGFGVRLFCRYDTCTFMSGCCYSFDIADSIESCESASNMQ